jgi:hypothetical protein
MVYNDAMLDYEQKYKELLKHFRRTLIAENEYKKLYEQSSESNIIWKQIALSSSDLETRINMARLIPGELTEDNIHSLVNSKLDKLV